MKQYAYQSTVDEDEMLRHLLRDSAARSDSNDSLALSRRVMDDWREYARSTKLAAPLLQWGQVSFSGRHITGRHLGIALFAMSLLVVAIVCPTTSETTTHQLLKTDVLSEMSVGML